MPISLRCHHCSHSLQVPDSLAGKRGKCPGCQTILEIPAAVAELAAAPAARPASAPTAGQAAAPKARQVAAADATATPVTIHKVATAGSRAAAHAPAAQPAAKQAAPKQSEPLSGEALRNAVMGGFRGRFERVPTSASYQIGILLTALFMVLLPIVYLSIIALVIYGITWHLTTNHVMLQAARGRAALFVLAAYLAPAIVGGIMSIFMIKPFFAWSSDDSRTRSLTPQSDPLLFEFVHHICELVGASRPRRIDVNCDVNAAAMLRNGWWSLLGNDMVLLIGLPLAAGMTLRQFGGVLAHEFGHFSQGFGMRLTYVIRTINFWFMRVVYQRDAWDDWIADTAGSVDIRIGWILYLAMGGIWLSRRVLWVLMYVGHLVAGFMLREMEFDADRYEARLSGSETFATTCRQLNLLGVAWSGAQSDLGSYFNEGRLADNLPKLLMANMKQLPKEIYALVDEKIAEGKGTMFDTHPPDKERIASAAAERAPGVFFCDLPATVLFSNFDAAARGVTEDYYRSIFGSRFQPSTMHSTDALLARSEGEQSVAEARDRFFAGAYTPLRPLRLPSLYEGGSKSANYWKDELVAARAKMEQLAPACRQAAEQLDDADTNFIEALQARAVLGCGVRMQIDRLKKFTSDAQATQGRQHAQIQLGRLSNQLEPFEDAAGARLRATLYLLENPAVAARIPNSAELQQEGKRMASLANQIAGVHNSLLELRNTNGTLAALLSHLEGNNRNDALLRDIIDYAGRIHGQLSQLKAQFAAVDYPFDHAHGQLTVSQFLLRYVPPREEIGSLFDCARELGQKLMELNSKIVSRLCALAETVENVFQLPPLPKE